MKARIIRWWRILRWISTDDAYERYLVHHINAHPERSPMSRRAFYLHEQERKWSGIQRCC